MTRARLVGFLLGLSVAAVSAQISLTKPSSGGGGGGTWGSITGTLSDQTDLQNALNARSPGGSDTQIQYNNAGNFGGSANLSFINTALSTPSAPTVTPQGTPGSST